VIWVYGICDRPELAPPHGLDGLREGALLAVFGRDSHAPDESGLWAHERVVERLMDDRTVLPMRFGSTVADEPALRSFLAEREASLLRSLASVRGRVELGIRVVAESADTPEIASGRDYLLSKMRDSAQADGVHEPLAALAADSRRRPPRGDHEVLRGAYLVDRTVLPQFSAGVSRLQDAHPEVEILCTGPWPPYTFASDA
jgi:hypothetical protein